MRIVPTAHGVDTMIHSDTSKLQRSRDHTRIKRKGVGDDDTQATLHASSESAHPLLIVLHNCLLSQTNVVRLCAQKQNYTKRK